MNRPILLSSFVLVLAGCAGETAPPPASPDDAARIATVEARLAATNQQDFDAWTNLHTEDACRTSPELPAPLCGRDAMRAAIEVLVRAFPDYHLELLQVIPAGEWLALRLHTSGTMTGPLLLAGGAEIPPTGRSIDQEWTALVHFDGAKIREFDEYYDQYTLLLQLGLITD